MVNKNKFDQGGLKMLTMLRQTAKCWMKVSQESSCGEYLQVAGVLVHQEDTSSW